MTNVNETSCTLSVAAGLCSETAAGVAFKAGELIGLYCGGMIQGGNAYHSAGSTLSGTAPASSTPTPGVARRQCNAELTRGAGGVIEVRATREVLHHQEILPWYGAASKTFVTG